MSDCTVCENPIGELRDNASIREARLSGLCQGCQDDYFGPDPEMEKTAETEGYDDSKSVDAEGRTELEWARMGCNDCLDGYCETHDTGIDTKNARKVPGWIKDSWA